MTTVADLIAAALTDPFRIVLLIGLVLTQRRTANQTGLLIPLALGVAFVAVLLPSTTGFGAEAGMPMAIGAGIIANILLVVPILLAFRLYDSRKR